MVNHTCVLLLCSPVRGAGKDIFCELYNFVVTPVKENHAYAISQFESALRDLFLGIKGSTDLDMLLLTFYSILVLLLKPKVEIVKLRKIRFFNG